MRKALLVGVDYYEHIGPLSGCVNDAHAVKATLERHADGTPNFVTPRLMVGTGATTTFDKGKLKDAVEDLFSDDSEIALFYFAGHGYIENIGGFLCTSECKRGDDGLSLSEVMALANNSEAKNKVIILDSCHSGVAGSSTIAPGFADIKEGTTILTASTDTQYAMEVVGGGAGVFTDLFVDALEGSAANLVGDVTPGAIYAHIDQSLGPWKQRPVFKTNVKTFVSLKRAEPPIGRADLLALTRHFPTAGFELQLDPSFEPERSSDQLAEPAFPKPDPVNTTVFALLQKYVKVNLVRPVGETHMWHAAMASKPCKLTVLGEHYRRLVEDGLI